MDLRVETPAISTDFVVQLAAAGVKLPLHLSHEDTGVVTDDEGREVFSVDVKRERPDREVISIAALIVVAVNTCGGFRAASGRAPV